MFWIFVLWTSRWPAWVFHYSSDIVCPLCSRWSYRQWTGSGSISDWLKSNPPSYNSYLISLSQASNNTKLTFAKKDSSITMNKLPYHGAHDSVHATLRLIVRDQSLHQLFAPKDALGKPFMLEPFDLPGMVVANQGKGRNLITKKASSPTQAASIFHFVPGLDGHRGTLFHWSLTLIKAAISTAAYSKMWSSAVRMTQLKLISAK